METETYKIVQITIKDLLEQLGIKGKFLKLVVGEKHIDNIDSVIHIKMGGQ